MQTDQDIPQGKDYQHGPLYFADSLRAAVFQRDRNFLAPQAHGFNRGLGAEVI